MGDRRHGGLGPRRSLGDEKSRSYVRDEGRSSNRAVDVQQARGRSPLHRGPNGRHLLHHPQGRERWDEAMPMRTLVQDRRLGTLVTFHAHGNRGGQGHGTTPDRASLITTTTTTTTRTTTTRTTTTRTTTTTTTSNNNQHQQQPPRIDIYRLYFDNSF